MNVLNIMHDSIVDGPGLRSTIFFAGCPHYCIGCHNPQSWNRNAGIKMTVEEIDEFVAINPINDITFSGGEPFLQIEELVILAKKLKQRGKNIWCYTGYKWEELLVVFGSKFIELCAYMDILVDGPFILDQRDVSLLYKGSKNQRIIDCKKSLEKKRIVLWKD